MVGLSHAQFLLILKRFFWFLGFNCKPRIVEAVCPKDGSLKVIFKFKPDIDAKSVPPTMRPPFSYETLIEDVFAEYSSDVLHLEQITKWIEYK